MPQYATASPLHVELLPQSVGASTASVWSKYTAVCPDRWLSSMLNLLLLSLHLIDELPEMAQHFMSLGRIVFRYS